jgi:hypothetical protein
MTEQLVETIPKPRRTVDGRLERVAQEVVKTTVTRIEQIEDFRPRAVRGEMLYRGMYIPCGDVFPLAKTGCENEYFFQNKAVLFHATYVNNL